MCMDRCLDKGLNEVKKEDDGEDARWSADTAELPEPFRWWVVELDIRLRKVRKPDFLVAVLSCDGVCDADERGAESERSSKGCANGSSCTISKYAGEGPISSLVSTLAKELVSFEPLPKLGLPMVSWDKSCGSIFPASSRFSSLSRGWS